MATKQGMCKNCGSLIMFDDRDDTCECVFCNCVFPSAEAADIMANPDGRVFPNEKFEAREGTHHHATRVFSDENIEKAVKRDKAGEGNSSESKKNEFEVSPNDVKAPPKLVAIVCATAAVIVLLVILIATPLYNSRMKLRKDITGEIATVFDGRINVDVTEDENGYPAGYSIWGQSSQNITVLTNDEVDEDTAKALFEGYCDLRADKLGTDDKYSKVEMKIYCENGIYSVSHSSSDTEAVLDEGASDKDAEEVGEN